MQSFSYQVKSELCRVPVQRVCCARAEPTACCSTAIPSMPGRSASLRKTPEFARRLPKLFHRAFSLRFDRLPQEQAGREKADLSDHRPGQAGAYHQPVRL